MDYDQGRGSDHWSASSFERLGGRKEGSITIGLQLSEPIQKVVSALKEKGVKFRGSIIDDDAVWAAHFEDPDGNELYLAEVKPQYKKHETGAATTYYSSRAPV